MALGGREALMLFLLLQMVLHSKKAFMYSHALLRGTTSFPGWPEEAEFPRLSTVYRNGHAPGTSQHQSWQSNVMQQNLLWQCFKISPHLNRSSSYGRE